MAARSGKTAKEKDAKALEAREVFKFVGGVPRLCLPSVSTAEDARKTVDGALAEYNILLLVKRLAALDDGIREVTSEQKQNCVCDSQREPAKPELLSLIHI